MDTWISYLHPVWQAASLVLGLYVLRLGLSFRRPADVWTEEKTSRSTARRAHITYAVLFLAMIALGYAAGASVVHIVGRTELLGSAHALAASLCLALFFATGYFGFRLKNQMGNAPARELHRFCAALAWFAALGAAVMGLALLP